MEDSDNGFSFTLAVRTGAHAVEFYKRAFGALEVHRAKSPDGAVVVQLDIAGDRFFVADESPEHGNFSPESLGNRSSVRLALIEAFGEVYSAEHPASTR